MRLVMETSVGFLVSLRISNSERNRNASEASEGVVRGLASISCPSCPSINVASLQHMPRHVPRSHSNPSIYLLSAALSVQLHVYCLARADDLTSNQRGLLARKVFDVGHDLGGAGLLQRLLECLGALPDHVAGDCVGRFWAELGDALRLEAQA